MSLLTIDEFKDRAVESDLTAILGDMAVDKADALIAQCIASGQQTLEGYADARYVTPLVATPQAAEFVFRLAWFAFLRRKNWNFGEGEREDEKLLLGQLQQVAKRQLALMGQTERGSVERATNIRETNPDARTVGTARKLTRKSMENF